MKFRLYVTYFGYYLPDEYDTLEEARQRAEATGYTIFIFREGKMIATQEPLLGWRMIRWLVQ